MSLGKFRIASGPLVMWTILKAMATSHRHAFDNYSWKAIRLICLHILLMVCAVIDIDSVGTFTMCHEALKYLRKGGPGKDSSSGGGTIINISATLHYTATWYQIHVSAAKVGVAYGFLDF